MIDESDVRRGAPSVNANWTNTVAILAGDFLMARASEVAATYLSQESVRLLAVTYAELVEGQTRELQLVGSLNHSLAEYERVIAGKTASLIRTSARLGAMASDAEPAVVEALTTWAWELGMVFQLADDALDLVGTEDSLGKPTGSDIREGKFTLPVLAAAHDDSGGRLRQLLSQPRPYPDDVADEAIRLLREGGWVDRAIDAALARVETAQRSPRAACRRGRPRRPWPSWALPGRPGRNRTATLSPAAGIHRSAWPGAARVASRAALNPPDIRPIELGTPIS